MEYKVQDYFNHYHTNELLFRVKVTYESGGVDFAVFNIPQLKSLGIDMYKVEHDNKEVLIYDEQQLRELAQYYHNNECGVMDLEDINYLETDINNVIEFIEQVEKVEKIEGGKQV